MLNFQWRLQALDPEASESLRVITFFDGLSEAHAGVEAILRSTAALSNGTVGLVDAASGRTTSATAAGEIIRTASGPPVEAALQTLAGDEQHIVFLHRDAGDVHTNDRLVLERLALSAAQALERAAAAPPRPALEVALDTASPPAALQDAITRLRLNADDRPRIIATPFAGSTPSAAPRAVVFTSYGMLLAQIATADESIQHAGIGVAVAPIDLARSWHTAQIALRMTTDRNPILRADDLGPLLLLDSVEESIYPADAFDTVLSAHPWALDTAEVLVRAASSRDAARILGIHHSTMQSRLRSLEESLGFDPATGDGATKLAVSFYRHLLRTRRF